MSRKAVVVVASGFLLLAMLFVAGCGGGAKDKSLDAESIVRNYGIAVFEGRADDAKAMGFATYEFRDEFLDKTDKAIAIFSQYEITDVKLVSTRPWTGGDSGEVDKRAELQFEYRRKGTSASSDIGIVYVRVTSSGGLWGITDIILALPDR